MAIRFRRNGVYMIDGLLEEYEHRYEAEEALRLVKILSRAKRQGRKIRGKTPHDVRIRRSK